MTKVPCIFFLYVNAKNTSYLMSWKQRLTMQRARFAALKLHRRLFRRNNVLMWRSFSFRTPTRFWPPLTCLMAYTLAVLHCFKSIPSTFADSQQKICPGKFNLSIRDGLFDLTLFTETRSFCLFFGPIVNSSREEAADGSSTHCSTHYLPHWPSYICQSHFWQWSEKF